MRGKQAKKRQTIGDPKFDSTQVTRLVNMVMLDGKKTVAQKIVYGALARLKDTLGQDELEVLQAVIKNVAPNVEVRSRRVGGSNYQVPVPVRVERKEMLAMRWIVSAARQRRGVDMETLLYQEMLSAFNGEGEAIKMRNNVHKMAEANKAFSHFRW